MAMKAKPAESFRRNKKAISPVISTVIITGAIIVLVTVAVVFANNFLSARMAEGDFNAAKQFMKTLGLQIDDVAWRIGQTETIRYTSRDGEVTFVNTTLTYKIEIKTVENPSFTVFSENSTGIVFFRMPVSKYSVSNNYYELIWPSSISNLTLKGSSVPVAKEFAVEKLSMYDGSYIRVVTAPMIRLVNSTITTATNSTFYFKLYLPLISLASAPKKSQSVTLTGESITAKTKNHITAIRITVSFPKASLGFDSTFYNFPTLQETINAPSGYNDCVIEFYTGVVSTSLGAYV
jgi:hypothetical protein